MLPNCPGCSYNLTGLMPPVTCPECGFAIDEKTLVLYGVVKADASQSPLRRFLWAVVLTTGGILGYTWFFLIFLGWFGLVFFLAWLASLIVMLRTSKRTRAGKNAIVFGAGGFIVVADLSDPEHEGEAVPWKRVLRVKFDRVSAVWYRLRLEASDRKLLEAGVRCTDEHAGLVYETLQAFRTGARQSADPAPDLDQIEI